MLARLREQCAVLAAAEERGRRLWAVAAAKAMGPGGQRSSRQPRDCRTAPLIRDGGSTGPSPAMPRRPRSVSSSWWGPYTPARSRADVGGRPGSLGRADQPWGPSVAMALDVQACAATGRGTATARAHGGAATGRRPAGRSGVPSPRPSADHGRHGTSRSQGAIRTHECAGGGVSNARATSGLGRHEEERIGGGCQAWGPSLAAARRPGIGAHR